MRHLITILVSTGIILALSLPGCIGGESESGEHDGGESAGEHGGSAESASTTARASPMATMKSRAHSLG